MPSSRLFQFRYSYERDIVEIYLKASIGASGAPTLVASKGVTSIVRNSTGNYTITLKDKHYLFLDADYRVQNATAPAAPGMYIVSESVNGTKQVVVQLNSAGTAADPDSGSTIMIRLAVRDAST